MNCNAAGATERLIEILQVESHIVAPVANPTSLANVTPEVAFDDADLLLPIKIRPARNKQPHANGP
ncbi:hypothetical protein O9929_27340 [Vibrio lentus]|nr:hypothetical protein [Vibrio lentus]